MRAIDALYEAQKIAFSPFVFQSTYTLLTMGVLDLLNEHPQGLSIAEIAEKTNASEYGIQVLVEMAEVAKILKKTQLNTFKLDKIGYFITNDEKTRINLNFTHDICYRGLSHLHESILLGEPAGLKELGSWETIYQGLSILPEKIKKSWFDFDHFYSDKSFDEALNYIFKDQPKLIVDIGGNTGKWALACTQYDPHVEVIILDLPVQLQVAKKNVAQFPELAKRIHFQAINMLDPDCSLPENADVYWMSQFLDCFSPQEIENILLKIKKSTNKNSIIYIMELFIDNQRFEASKFSLIATSLYFTTMANGNSKMYSLEEFKKIIDRVELKQQDEYYINKHNFHTILKLTLED